MKEIDMRHEIPEIPFNMALYRKVVNFELSMRTKHCMKNYNIVYVGDLVQKSEAELLRTPNFGLKSLNEIMEMLKQMGFHLEMEINFRRPEIPLNLPFKKVDELKFSGRTANFLKNNNIVNIGELVQKTEVEILRLPNSGHNSLKEIKKVLKHMGLYLGMQVVIRGPEIPFNPELYKEIDDLELSPRTKAGLKKDNIVYIGELVQKSDVEILHLPYFGARPPIEIKEALAQKGLHLGMEITGWPTEIPFNPMLLGKVNNLRLSASTKAGLKKEDIFFIGELVQKSDPELLHIPNFGHQSLDEIKEVLKRMNFHLGMEVTGWPF